VQCKNIFVETACEPEKREPGKQVLGHLAVHWHNSNVAYGFVKETTSS